MKNFRLVCPALLLPLLMAACSLLPESKATAFPNPSAVYATVAAGLTQTAPPTLQPTPSVAAVTHTSPATPGANTPTSQSTLSQDPSFTLTLTPVPAPCNLAAPGRPSVDVTIPDGTHLKPNQPFTKTWRLVNSGTCTWTSDYAIVFFSGDPLGAIKSQKIGYVVPPGVSVDLSVDMVAPRQAGVRQGNWKLSTAGGALFGIGPTGDAPFWVRIEVDLVATATLAVQPSLTPTPTLAAVAKGVVQLFKASSFDLDRGAAATGPEDDLALELNAAGKLSLALRNGALLSAMPGATIMQVNECLQAELKSDPLIVESLKEEAVFCYRTNRGLPGFFRIKSVALKEESLTLDYLTWMIP